MRTTTRLAGPLALAVATLALAAAATAQQPPIPPSQRPAPLPPSQQRPQPQPQAQPQRQAQPQPGQGQNLDRLITGVGPLCMKAPAAQCIDQGFAFADQDRNQRLSPAEARRVHDEVNAWTKVNAPKLPPQERERLLLGLAVVQTVGPDAIFASYDTNRDGGVTKDELLADVRLDQRPLPQVLSDPSAVDWQRLTDRAGMAGPLLKRLLPPL